MKINVIILISIIFLTVCSTVTICNPMIFIEPKINFWGLHFDAGIADLDGLNYYNDKLFFKEINDLDSKMNCYSIGINYLNLDLDFYGMYTFNFSYSSNFITKFSDYFLLDMIDSHSNHISNKTNIRSEIVYNYFKFDIIYYLKILSINIYKNSIYSYSQLHFGIFTGPTLGYVIYSNQKNLLRTEYDNMNLQGENEFKRISLNELQLSNGSISDLNRLRFGWQLGLGLSMKTKNPFYVKEEGDIPVGQDQMSIMASVHYDYGITNVSSSNHFNLNSFNFRLLFFIPLPPYHEKLPKSVGREEDW